MRYESAQAKLSNVEMLMGNIVRVLDGLPKARALDSQIERLTLKKLELESELFNLRGRLEDTALALATEICREYADDELAQTLLLLRYVECCSWNEISRRMNYSRRNVGRLHGEIISRISAH